MKPLGFQNQASKSRQDLHCKTLWNTEPFPLGIDLIIYISIVNTNSSGQSIVAREGLQYNARDINPRLFVANYAEPSKSGLRQVSPVTNISKFVAANLFSLSSGCACHILRGATFTALMYNRYGTKYIAETGPPELLPSSSG